MTTMIDDTEYEWLPEDTAWGWTADPAVIRGRTCSQPKCLRNAVAAFYRSMRRGLGGYTKRINLCCDLPEHLYGRRVNAGRIEWRYLKGSPAYIRAKVLSTGDSR